MKINIKNINKLSLNQSNGKTILIVKKIFKKLQKTKVKKTNRIRDKISCRAFT